VTAPNLASVADHEASHAVVWWWWWASQPEARDPGTGQEIWRITIEPTKDEEGGFHPNNIVFGTNGSRDDILCMEHACAMSLAGPVSDEMREEPRLHYTDVNHAKGFAKAGLPTEEEATSFLEELRPRVRLFLERPEVRAMVQGLAKELLEHETLGHDDAVAAMKAAQPSQ
jgi:hypothetical protein